MKKDKAKKSSRSHTQYKSKDGEILPGASTVANMLAKEALLPWANKLGREGIDYTSYMRATGRIGTLGHYLILCHIKGEKPDLAEYSPDEIDQAENSLLSYFEWEKRHTLEPILMETPLVDETWRFGGTLDWYGKLDGNLAILDYKTGSGIWDSYWIQISGYLKLLESNNYKCDEVWILNIPRTEDDSFIDQRKDMADLRPYLHIFSHLLGIWWIKRSLKK